MFDLKLFDRFDSPLITFVKIILSNDVSCFINLQYTKKLAAACNNNLFIRTSTSSKMGRQKVIIDCDPGIDDTMALFMAIAAHSKGELEVMAITLVSGNTSLDNCARNVTRVLETTNKSDKVNSMLEMECKPQLQFTQQYVFSDSSVHGCPERPDSQICLP